MSFNLYKRYTARNERHWQEVGVRSWVDWHRAGQWRYVQWRAFWWSLLMTVCLTYAQFRPVGDIPYYEDLFETASVSFLFNFVIGLFIGYLNWQAGEKAFAEAIKQGHPDALPFASPQATLPNNHTTHATPHVSQTSIHPPPFI